MGKIVWRSDKCTWGNIKPQRKCFTRAPRTWRWTQLQSPLWRGKQRAGDFVILWLSGKHADNHNREDEDTPGGRECMHCRSFTPPGCVYRVNRSWGMMCTQTPLSPSSPALILSLNYFRFHLHLCLHLLFLTYLSFLSSSPSLLLPPPLSPSPPVPSPSPPPTSSPPPPSVLVQWCLGRRGRGHLFSSPLRPTHLLSPNPRVTNHRHLGRRSPCLRRNLWRFLLHINTAEVVSPLSLWSSWVVLALSIIFRVGVQRCSFE